MPTSITTRQLILRPATLALVEAELESRSALALALEADVPLDWPPGEYDRAALEFFHAALAQCGAAGVGWYGWYALERPNGPGRPVLVGAGGFIGPPDRAGIVEIGYSILPAWRRRGLATELVAALIDRACESGQVLAIWAHTTPANEPSIGVLVRNGFVLVGAGAEPGSVRYEYRTVPDVSR